MGKIVADSSTTDSAAEIAALKAQLAAMTAAASRSSKQPGFYVVPVKTEGKEHPARYRAERILTDRSVVSFYVGFNGQLTVGGRYKTFGITAWKDTSDAVKAYAINPAENGLAADIDRVIATGHVADKPAAE
jgi:hypothetical protein